MESMSKLKMWRLDVKATVFGTVGVIALLNGCVAILAFFKDVLIATNFGTSLEADSLTLAFFLPDTIGNNLIASALGVSCVPVFAKAYAAGNKAQFVKLVRNLTLVFGFLSVIVWLVLWAYSDVTAVHLAGSNDPSLGQLTTSLMRILLPMIAVFPLIAIASSLLQIKGNFAFPAATPLVSHVLTISMLISCMVLALNRLQTVYLVSWSLLVGALAMAGAIWFVVWLSKPVQAKSDGKLQGHAVTELYSHHHIWKVFVPYILILATSQTIFLIERNLAAGMETGTIAGLNYAFRLSQLPIWVFVSAIYSVVLPSMSQDSRLQRTEKLQATLSRAIKLILLVTLPTTFLLYLLRIPIVSILFQRGAFDEHSVFLTSDIVKGYALAIIGTSVTAICMRYFLAAGRMILPLGVMFLASIVNILVDYQLKDRLGAAGLGYGAAVGATISALLFIWLLSRELKFPLRTSIKWLRDLLLINVLPFVLLLLLSVTWNVLTRNSGTSIKILLLVSVSGTCAILYLSVLHKMNWMNISGRKGR